MFVIIGLLIHELIRKNNYEKTNTLMISFGWLALAWGSLGHVFGMIIAYDRVSTMGEFSMNVIGPGYHLMVLDPLLGLLTFVVARICSMVLIGINK